MCLTHYILIMTRCNLAPCYIQMLVTTFLVQLLLLYFTCWLTIEVLIQICNFTCIELKSYELHNFKSMKMCYFMVSQYCHMLKQNVYCDIQVHAKTILTSLWHWKSVTFMMHIFLLLPCKNYIHTHLFLSLAWIYIIKVKVSRFS